VTRGHGGAPIIECCKEADYLEAIGGIYKALFHGPIPPFLFCLS